ncbi:hypothetical protein F5J12DRAFT_789035 [Pisolithus orientalis]|uniref:uncharacterized protein n=1 Tax=Pisolithus orientalis TaxID=936130 RepID=UPI002224761C|nr:uncharacterized protein F5J12DRAFT_789035 [Pisolithus orientalis]KAI5980683.1 hypothetical protein F5J12DRAFT_789035 [Pisolithus orientalis]
MFYVGDFEILACHTSVQKPFTSSFIQYKLHEANVEAQTLVLEAIRLDGLEKLFSLNAYEKWLPEVCYCKNTTPSDMPFNPTLDRHLVWAVNAIPFITSQSHPSHQSVVGMGILYLACWIEVASVHLKQTANITGWPAHWFANLAMDLLMMAQGLWPLPEAPITDHLNGHIKEQEYADVVNGWGQQINHFYTRWWALCRLLGMPLQ